MSLLKIENDGPEIVSTNFWELPLARGGKLLVSPNAGAFRLLVPGGQEHILPEMQTGKTIVISRGAWPPMRLPDAFELMFDDGSDNPFALHLSPESFDRLPLDSDGPGPWAFTAWFAPRRGKPRKVLERPCWYRRVPSIPHLEPWE